MLSFLKPLYLYVCEGISYRLRFFAGGRGAMHYRLTAIALRKQTGFPIGKSRVLLESLVQRFIDPDPLCLAIESRSGYARRPPCVPLTSLRFQSNGNVIIIPPGFPPIASISRAPVRQFCK